MTESRAIAIQITLSLHCPDLPGNYFINISAVSSVTFLPHLLSVIIERNAQPHRDQPKCQPNSAPGLSCLGRPKSQVERHGQKWGEEQTTDLSPGTCLSICPSIHGYIIFASQVTVCSDMHSRCAGAVGRDALRRALETWDLEGTLEAIWAVSHHKQESPLAALVSCCPPLRETRKSVTGGGIGDKSRHVTPRVTHPHVERGRNHIISNSLWSILYFCEHSPLWIWICVHV